MPDRAVRAISPQAVRNQPETAYYLGPPLLPRVGECELRSAAGLGGPSGLSVTVGEPPRRNNPPRPPDPRELPHDHRTPSPSVGDHPSTSVPELELTLRQRARCVTNMILLTQSFPFRPRKDRHHPKTQFGQKARRLIEQCTCRAWPGGPRPLRPPIPPPPSRPTPAAPRLRPGRVRTGAMGRKGAGRGGSPVPDASRAPGRDGCRMKRMSYRRVRALVGPRRRL